MSTAFGDGMIHAMRTSYSALQTLKTCPLKFKYQEIERVKAPKSKEAVFGTVVHSALRFMFTHDPLYPSLNQVIDHFAARWSEAQEKIAIIPEETGAYRKQGIALLVNFYKKNQPWNFRVLELESRFEVALKDATSGESHVVAGVMDRIDKLADNMYEIIDYKTAKRMPSQAGADADLQMSMYHLGLLHKWPSMNPANITLSLYFLKHGEKISTTRSAKTLEETKQHVLSALREIKERMTKDDFPATPSPLCDWCGYRPICPMWKHLYQNQEVKIKNQKELEPVLEEYIELKEQNQTNGLRLKALQATIRDFMDRENIQRVFGKKGYITKSVRQTPVYDLEKVKAILAPIGKWEEILKADDRKLTGLIAKLAPPQQEELGSTITAIRQTTTLIFSKKKINFNADVKISETQET